MILDFIRAATSLDGIQNYLEENTGELPVNIDPSYFGGELKDHLSILTSSYSFVSSLVDSANYIIDLLNEGLELKTNECIKQLKKSSAPAKGTQKERLNAIRELPVGTLEICGEIVMKKCSIQDIIEYRVRCEYLRNRLKSLLNTIDKSMSVGNTILSYNKQELAKMYNAT